MDRHVITSVIIALVVSLPLGAVAVTAANTATATKSTPQPFAGTAELSKTARNDVCPAHLNHEFRKLHSREIVNLCTAFAGKPLLIINTASHCGFTPQFKGLEALHQKYGDQGLVVLGFSSNDFRQEAGNEEKAAKVCYINYGVTFTMLAPISVKGEDAHPLFQELARQSRAPNWNFNKYLVEPSGAVIQHFGSTTTPDSSRLIERIEGLLPTKS